MLERRPCPVRHQLADHVHGHQCKLNPGGGVDVIELRHLRERDLVVGEGRNFADRHPVRLDLDGVDRELEIFAEGGLQSGNLVQIVLHDEIERRLVVTRFFGRTLCDTGWKRGKQPASLLHAFARECRQNRPPQYRRGRRGRKLRIGLERIGVACPCFKSRIAAAGPGVGLDEQLPGNLVRCGHRRIWRGLRHGRQAGQNGETTDKCRVYGVSHRRSPVLL